MLCIENSNNKYNTDFGITKIMDATGKVLTREELIKLMKMKEENLKKQKEYIKNNFDDEMFENIPRQR